MVFIIGEIGTNHAGDIKIAKKIIDAAKNAGFDAVKFQKKNVEKIYTQEFLDSVLESPWGKTQREMRTHREFSEKQFKEIDQYCKKQKIPWFFSAWDIDSQLSMRKFKTKYNKIASAMLVHDKLLEKVAEEKKINLASSVKVKNPFAYPFGINKTVGFFAVKTYLCTCRSFEGLCQLSIKTAATIAAPFTTVTNFFSFLCPCQARINPLL